MLRRVWVISSADVMTERLTCAWHYDEAQVACWHEIRADFSGQQLL